MKNSSDLKTITEADLAKFAENSTKEDWDKFFSVSREKSIKSIPEDLKLSDLEFNPDSKMFNFDI